LFYASRTRWTPPPPPPTPPPVVRAPPPPTHYTLAGVVVSGSARTALVKSQNGRTTTILVEGQQLDGWTLKEITDSQLLFIAGSATYEMKLPKPSEVRR
jgi:type II secretory pathway component PulC